MNPYIQLRGLARGPGREGRDRLTAAQQRVLDEIRAAGPTGRVYTGRALVVLRNLEARGLIEFTMSWTLTTWRAWIVRGPPK